MRQKIFKISLSSIVFSILFFNISFVSPTQAATSADELWGAKTTQIKKIKSDAPFIKTPEEFRKGIVKIILELFFIGFVTMLIRSVFKYLNCDGVEEEMYEGRNMAIKGAIGLITTIIIFKIIS